jgi:hypothetical protein
MGLGKVRFGGKRSGSARPGLPWLVPAWCGEARPGEAWQG